MAAASLSTLSAILKTYSGKIMDVSMFSDKLWQTIKGNTEQTAFKQEGNAFYYHRPAKTSNGDNAGPLAEGGTWPTYDPTLGIDMKWPCTTIGSVLQLTDSAVQAGGCLGPGDTVDMKNFQMQGLMTDWALKFSSQIVGQAKGWWTTVDGASSSTTVKVRDTSFLRKGQRIIFYGVSSDSWTANTGPGTSGVCTVSTVNHQTRTITVAANGSTIVDGSYLVPYPHYGIALNGIGDILAHGTENLTVGSYIVRRLLDSYGNQSRTSYPALEAPWSWVGTANTPADFTALALFEWIADMASAQDGQMCGATDVFGHPHTLISVWNAIAQLRTMGIKDNRVEYGAKGECTFSHPTLRDGTVTIKGLGGWKKYVLDAFDFSDKENSKMRWDAPPHWVETDETGGIFRYAGAPGATDTWSGVYKTLVGMPWNPAVCGTLAGINLPANKQCS
jgi:hypothetical protein